MVKIKKDKTFNFWLAWDKDGYTYSGDTLIGCLWAIATEWKNPENKL